MKVKRIFLAVLVTGLLTLALVGIPAIKSFADDDQHMEGSWQITMTPRTANAPSPYLALATFGREGTVLSLDHWGLTYLGEWERVKNSEHNYTSHGMYYNGGDYYVFSTKGSLTLNQKANEFTGTFKTKILDANGNVIATFTGTTKAKRVEVD